MKKRFAGFVVLAAAAAAVAAIIFKKEEEPVLITLDEETEEEETDRVQPIEEEEMDQEHPNLKASEADSWETRIKIMLKPLADKQQVKLIHYCTFHNQHDLFDAVKDAKINDYILAEANEKHEVVLEKIMANFFDDISKAVLSMVDITKKHNGVYNEFKIE